MATWSKNTARVRDNGFGGSRGGKRIEGAVIHHGAGLDVLDYVANANSRDSHPTYHVNRAGTVTGIVHPDRRPFSTSHSVDSVAITFELDNSEVGGNWPVSEDTLSAMIDVCVDHARQAGLKRFARNTPGSDQPGVFFIAWHSQYVATACPGPHVLSRIDWIISECQRRLDGGSTPTPAPTPQPEATGFERAPGGEPGAPMWPVGALMARIQRGLSLKKRYNYADGSPRPADGIGGEHTAKGIQRTLNHSRKNGKVPHVPTDEDGKLGPNNGWGVQHYGKAFGDYGGSMDGDPRGLSWTAFALGLERP